MASSDAPLLQEHTPRDEVVSYPKELITIQRETLNFMKNINADSHEIEALSSEL